MRSFLLRRVSLPSLLEILGQAGFLAGAVWGLLKLGASLVWFAVTRDPSQGPQTSLGPYEWHGLAGGLAGLVVTPVWGLVAGFVLALIAYVPVQARWKRRPLRLVAELEPVPETGGPQA